MCTSFWLKKIKIELRVGTFKDRVYFLIVVVSPSWAPTIPIELVSLKNIEGYSEFVGENGGDGVSDGVRDTGVGVVKLVSELK